MTQYMQEAGAMKQADEQREAFEAAMRAKHPEWAFTADPVFDYHNERTRCAWEGWQAALAAALPPAAVQAGWKLVPIEPTDTMQMAGAMAVRMDTTALNRIWTGNAVWRAMLAEVDEGTLTAGKQGGDEALRIAGAAGLLGDADVLAPGVTAGATGPVVGSSGSDWEAVGGFRFDQHAGWQQVAAEYANDSDVTTLYRKRNAGVALGEGGNDGR